MPRIKGQPVKDHRGAEIKLPYGFTLQAYSEGWQLSIGNRHTYHGDLLPALTCYLRLAVRTEAQERKTADIHALADLCREVKEAAISLASESSAIARRTNAIKTAGSTD